MPRKGQQMPDAQREKIRAAACGRKKLPDEIAKISAAAKRQWAEGRISPKMDRTGILHTEASKLQMRETWERLKREDPEGFRVMVVERNRKANIRWGEMSGLEKWIAGWLTAHQIEFETHVPIGRYAVDFVVEGWLVIEANGCWWHRCKECGFKDDIRAHFRDARRYRSIRSRGWCLAVIWEHELEGVMP